MSKKIILIIIFLFIVSAFWLSWKNERAINPNAGKNWWIIYFNDPKGERLDFTLENHSGKENFSYAVFQNGEKLFEDEIKIKKGEIELVEIDEKFTLPKTGKVIITVSQEKETREIYKNFYEILK